MREYSFSLFILSVLIAVAIWIGPSEIIEQWMIALSGTEHHPDASLNKNKATPTLQSRTTQLSAAQISKHPIPTNTSSPTSSSSNSFSSNLASSNQALSKPAVPIKRQATPTPTKRVFQWTDAKGVIHYGDEKPTDHNLSIKDRSDEFSFQQTFSVDIKAVSYELPLDTESKVEIAVSNIFEIYRNALGLNYRDDAHINVSIYGKYDEFEQYRNLYAPKAETITGFYLPAKNEAIIWKNRNTKTMLSVTTHECSHAILGYKVGRSPAWLNEGLAEYFETMEVFGFAVVVPPHKAWDELIQERYYQQELMPLQEYLALTNEEWRSYNGDDGSAYSMAWSLVYYLMGTREGRLLLKKMIVHLEPPSARAKGQETSPLQPRQFNSIDSINKFYYGGIKALELNWHQWIRRNKTAHRY